MKPIPTEKITEKTDWIYEVKYDGFRAMLIWKKDNITLISKNKHDLTQNFPEIIAFCKAIETKITNHLPLIFDGELVILNHTYQANFAAIQQRGRLKTKEKIDDLATSRPATFIIFDIMLHEGKSLQNLPLHERKRVLNRVAKPLQLSSNKRLQLIDSFSDYETVSAIVFNYKSEGIIAKRKASKYIGGKSHHDWFKEKNWRNIHTFLTAYDSLNEYYHIGILADEKIKLIGKCKHGLGEEEAKTLKQIFIENGEKKRQIHELPPAICAQIHTLDLLAGELREPQFAKLLPNENPLTCTEARLATDIAMFPKVDLSNLDKIFWPQMHLSKGNLLVYIREIYPYMIPHLQDRALTVIRCPDGVDEEFFYQKHVPSYAPKYVQYFKDDEKKHIVCNNLESLVWLANHSAIEYHIPFQTVNSPYPTEIVFDLDPPNREQFVLAIHAAKLIKDLLDELNLTSFVKTSGNKGLQIHVPLPLNKINYEQTAVLTEAIAKTVESIASDMFTTERMKKNRDGRLYIDYVQHGKNKTIIAPYSPRKTEDATVATPLYWYEVTESLRPEQFTIENVVDRVKEIGCPWMFEYDEARNQDLTKVERLLEK